MPSGQNTRIIIGPAEADVSLQKTSGKPAEAKHDVRRVDRFTAPTIPVSSASSTVVIGDPFGSTAPPPSMPETVHVQPPETRPVWQKGVNLPDGTFVDLTRELEEIDRRTRTEGLTIACTIAGNLIPRTWVRDAYYIVPRSEGATTFLSYIWEGLTAHGVAAIVRWTKRTDQYLCAILPRGVGGPHLILVQLEWSQNLRPMPERAVLDLESVTEVGREKAAEAMEALRVAPPFMSSLRDERAAQRAELLTAAREGRRWTAPEPVTSRPTEELGDVLVAAVR